MSSVNFKSSFPEGFLWGASTAAHQVEGGNNNDWSVWEQANAERLARSANPKHNYGNGRIKLPAWEAIAGEALTPNNYISGQAVGNWEHWQEDVDIAKSLGMNALRYSIEWSRVQPTIDTFSQAALDHYAGLTNYCLDNGIVPVATLHHFTNPNWVAARGSWEDKGVINLFTQYVKKVTEVLPTEDTRWVVINEPNVYAGCGWILGEWPPQRHNPIKYRQVTKNLAEAHKRSYDVIKAASDSAQVSSAVNYTHFDAKNGLIHGVNSGIAWLGRRMINEWFQNATIEHQDYVALNHYMHCVVDLGLYKNDEAEPQSDLGWFLNPQSLLYVLREAAKYRKPIIITENGLADAQDEKRAWFINQSVDYVKAALYEGIDVQGYLHWSLLDNFEWDKGFWPKFGLVKVDRQTMERTPRSSALAYQEIIAKNSS
jgi:beta-glucosidase